MEYKLYTHQKELIQKNPPRHGIFFGTGTGKTITAIALADNNCKSCTVIVPKSLVKKWERDIQEFSVLARCAYQIYSKEQFKKFAKDLLPTDGVIVDECHYFAGEKSQMSKALQWYMRTHDVKYRWLLTATPYLSTPMNIWTLARHLGHDWNYWSFKREFFDEIRMGSRIVPKVKKGIEGKLAALVRSIGSAIDMEAAVALSYGTTTELPPVPPQSFETEFFDLYPDQEKAIAELDDDLFITRWTKTHCIENGILYSDGYTLEQVFLSRKTERLIEIAKSVNKIAVFCRYTAQIDLLKRVFTGGSKEIFIVDGRSSGEERDAIVRSADAAEKAIVIIQSACSAGYELPSFNLIVFMSLDFSYVNYSQACGRFLRINLLTENKYIHLVSRGVDKDVHDSIMRKEDFSWAIYGKTK